MKNSRSIYVPVDGILLFFFMVEEYSIAYMYHQFFINFSPDGYLVCFYVLDILNSAKMNIRVHASFVTMIFSRYRPRSVIAGSYGSSFFFKEPLTFSIVAILICIPIHLVDGFLFCTLTAFIVCRFLDGHSGGC